MSIVTVLTQILARLLLLPILMVALGVLVKGYASVGDGFSAGIIAALGLLLQYLVSGYRNTEQFLPFSLVAPLTTAGLFLAFAVGFAPLLWGRPIFSHLPAPGQHVVSVGTLELHTAILFDVGVFFLVVGFVLRIARTLAQPPQEPPT